jgi:hypothetical protein
MPDTSTLNLPELSVVIVWLVAATVFLIQKLKMLLCCHFKGSWTQRIPGWVWLVASIVVPLGLILLLAQHEMQDAINAFLPDGWQIHMSTDAVEPPALTATIGANGSYAVARKLGLAADYSPGGPLDVTPAPLGLAPIVPAEAPESPSAVTTPETQPPALPTPISSPEVSPSSVPESCPPVTVQRLFTTDGPTEFVVVTAGLKRRVAPLK